MRMIRALTSFFKSVAGRWRAIHSSLVLFTRRFFNTLRFVDGAFTVMSFVAAMVFIVVAMVYVGFEHQSVDLIRLHRIVHVVQGVFIAKVLLTLLMQLRNNFTYERKVMLVVDALVLLTVLPLIYPRPHHPWLPWLERFLYSEWFLYLVMATYSVICISYGVSKLLGKRTNPSLMLSGSFLVFIIIGSLLLMLPKCTYDTISYIDALFVSTSAVCITGLTPVDVATTFTPMGLLVLGMLIQIGGLGVLTFTCFFALFFTGSTSIFNQLMLKDVVYSTSMSALMPTLLYILGFTLSVEGIGAALILLSVHGTLDMSFDQELIFAAFHSVSAFCNAGFSNLPGGLSNAKLLYSNQSIYWVVSLLILSGSIGFPMLVNLKEAFFNFVRRRWSIMHRRKPANRMAHKFNMNTKVVVVTSMSLLVIGAVAFYILEANNTLRYFTPLEKVTQSVFNSVVPRSAGFSSVNPAAFLNSTLVIVMFLMWVGGASQSTAGGVKVNTFAAIMLNLRAVVTGHRLVVCYGRTVSEGSMRRANAVVALSIVTYLLYSVVLLIMEPGLGTRELLFESLSALFTVGSSLGATNDLSAASKILLCTAMFMGRVGGLSVLIGLRGRNVESFARFPEDTLIIN